MMQITPNLNNSEITVELMLGSVEFLVTFYSSSSVSSLKAERLRKTSESAPSPMLFDSAGFCPTLTLERDYPQVLKVILIQK